MNLFLMLIIGIPLIEIYLFIKIGSLIGAINQKKLSNIKIYQNDVRDLFDREPEEIFDLIIIICPDPWPKEKHHKRRLINKEFLQIPKAKNKKPMIFRINPKTKKQKNNDFQKNPKTKKTKNQ